jgi:hypothetical protein
LNDVRGSARRDVLPTGREVTDDTKGFLPFSSQEAHERMDADVEESLGQLGAVKGRLLL